MSQATPRLASAAATEATYTDVPPATSSPGGGAGDDCIASSATRSILSRTSSRTGGTRSPSRCDSARGSHRHGAPERSYIATSLLSDCAFTGNAGGGAPADGVCRQTPTGERPSGSYAGASATRVHPTSNLDENGNPSGRGFVGQAGIPSRRASGRTLRGAPWI